MATRLIGVDDANPKLPDVVVDATRPSSAEALAGDDTTLMTPADTKLVLDARSIFVLPSGDVTGATDNASIAAAKTALSTGTVGRVEFGVGEFFITGSAMDWTTDDDLYAAVIQGQAHGGNPDDVNPHGTQIVQLDDNVPILKTWGAQHVDGLCLIYANQQTTSNTAAIGCSINNVAGGSITNVRVWKAHIGFGIPQTAFGTSGYNASFNTTFAGLHSYEASKTHFDFRNFSGGGTNCRLGPLYVNGGGSLDFVTPGQSCDYAIRGGNMLGWEFGAISIDGLIVNERLVDIPTGNNYVTIDTIRCEAVDWNKDADGLITLGGSDNICTINIVELKNTKWTPASTTSMYLLRTNATRNVLDVGTVFVSSDCDFGASGVRRALINSAADTGSDIRLGVLSDTGARLSDLVWNDSIPATTLTQPVRYWNGALVNEGRRAGRSANTHRVFVATAIPTTGTYATDDELIMDVVSAGDPVCAYRCTVGGTPGTWRPIAWIVGRGTTATRPTLTASDVGVMYLDNTLAADGKPVWWNGTAWVDATGTVV